MEVNDTVLSLSLWATSFAMWMLVYMYGFWQMVRAAQGRQKIARLWVTFLVIWMMSIPVAIVLRRIVNGD